MPKHYEGIGQKIIYHPLVVRFTLGQIQGIRAVKTSSGKSMNEVVRFMVDQQLKTLNLSGANGKDVKI